jgi:hypothetical protein
VSTAWAWIRNTVLHAPQTAHNANEKIKSGRAALGTRTRPDTTASGIIAFDRADGECQ